VAKRAPLRVKLITAVLGLVGVAIVLISVASIFLFRDYLIERADQQVRQQYELASLYLQSGRLAPGSTLSGDSTIIAWRFLGHQLSEPFGTGPGRPSVDLPNVPVSPAWLRAHVGQLVTVDGLNSPDRWRVIAEPIFEQLDNKQLGTLIAGVNLGDVNGSIARLAAIDAIIGALVLAVLATVGVAMVRASLRPLSDIERTAQAIAAGDLSRRVPDQDPRTEVGGLGQSLNAMLAQIEAAFRARAASEEAARRSGHAARTSAIIANRSEERMRQFVADASHELRTPLTAIRGYAEYYRQRGGVVSEPELDRIIERVEQEAKRMGVLVNDMLLLARLDQQPAIDLRTVDLLAITVDALHDSRVIAPKRTITLTVETPDAALVIGDEVRLRQVVGNLMSNAITHTPEGTPIDITIRSGPLASAGANGTHADAADPAVPASAGAAPAVLLEVTDRGPGLTAEQREHVFERFYRTDRARSRTAGGTGLGLAIVAALVKAHHGRVWVTSTPGQGATFGFALPLAPEAVETSP
jgi:two-component system, OmpR family, sensor kinase